MILLTPGPCMTSESVRLAAAQPDLNHRDPEYLLLQNEVKERLLGIYPTDHHKVFLVGGSGTAAVESALSSCIGSGPVLLLENGYYSERAAAICDVYRIPYTRLRFGWTDRWELSEIEQALEGGGFEAVFGLHNETTVGRLNPVERVGELCQRYGARFIVDAMSSFGADPLDLHNVDVVCASANKCLHGIPGVSFVLAKEQVVAHLPAQRTYYLSLGTYAGEEPPLTPPVPALASLRQALREYPGQAARRADYLEKQTLIREALERNGLMPLLPQEESSCSVTAATLPRGYSGEAWLQANRERGFLLYGCKGTLRDRYFLVANMGELSLEDVLAWTGVLDGLL